MSDDVPTLGQQHRVRVFVDFWNYSLSMRDVDENFRTDWSKLGPVLSNAAVAVINNAAVGEYQGLNFYGSYDPASEGDRKLHRWATAVVDTFPGVSVSIVPRQKKRSPPKCPFCHVEVTTCPVCGADMRGTEEKGVDVRMATDMISLAWVDNYDVAVLVSSDRDFVPVAEFLETRGIKVIHGAFPPKGAQLTRKCWGSINIADLREGFRFRQVKTAAHKPHPPPTQKFHHAKDAFGNSHPGYDSQIMLEGLLKVGATWEVIEAATDLKEQSFGGRFIAVFTNQKLQTGNGYTEKTAFQPSMPEAPPGKWCRTCGNSPILKMPKAAVCRPSSWPPARASACVRGIPETTDAAARRYPAGACRSGLP